ncbi:metal-independent phosphoserine phosphatase [Silene latifolia]|uniref:metal-independent phosphoserine phosphatase n=1 Tax=Silene latifolia TaxID=37657 RepID=UPI003D772F97
MAAETAPCFSRNRFWILRHGKSIPNEQGLIVSSMENGILPEYQLGSEGVAQAQLAGEKFLKELKDANIALENVRICYSPFSRTAHTARVVASVLNIPFEGPQCKAFEDIRERYFGPSYELSSYERYPEIWDLDEKDPFEQPEGGESVADVVSRLITAIEQIETIYEGCAILIVSHGDPLQMLQTVLSAAKEQNESNCSNLGSRLTAVKVPSVLSKHRNFALETAELRAVI